MSAALVHFPDARTTVAVLSNVGLPGRNIDAFQMVPLLAMAATDA